MTADGVTTKAVAAFRDQVLGLIDDLRSYASAWDWKYGEEWDRERAAIDAVLAARIRTLLNETTPLASSPLAGEKEPANG